MNAGFTREPTKAECELAVRATDYAHKLAAEYGAQCADNREWDNRANVQKSQVRLMAYIALLESQVRSP